MKNELTNEQAKKLLKAIFEGKDEKLETAGDDEPENDNYPETISEKVDYAEYVITRSLENIGRTIHRLSRLNHLLKISGVPDIITCNELRMALEPLLIVENDIKDIAEMLTEAYKETKPKEQTDEH